MFFFLDGYFIRTLRDVLPSADGLFIEISRTRQPCWRRKLRNKARKHFSFRFYGGVFESRLEALDVSRHDEAIIMNSKEAILPHLSPASISSENLCTPIISPCTLRLQKCPKEDAVMQNLSPPKVLQDKSQLMDYRKNNIEKLNYSSPYMNSMPSDSSTYYSLESDTTCEKFVHEHFVKSEKKEIPCYNETKIFQRPFCSYETTNELFETQQNMSDYNSSGIQNSLVTLDHSAEYKNFSNKYSCPTLNTEKYKDSLDPSSSTTTTTKGKDCLQFFAQPVYPESYTTPYDVEKYSVPPESSNNIVDGSYSPSYSLYTPYHTLQELLKI
jgi:hypothetical protein